jgi:hypothetical protein
LFCGGNGSLGKRSLSARSAQSRRPSAWRADLHRQQVAGHHDAAFTMKSYVHASDEDLRQGTRTLARIHKIA